VNLLKFNHDSISGIYNQLTDLISFYQTVESKNYLVDTVKVNKSVLDIGCGNGDFAISCAKKASNVVGLDVSIKMIRNAKKAAADNKLTNVNFQIEDFFSFEIDKKFDYVTLVYFLNIFQDENTVEDVLKKVKSFLRPGGHILIADELEPRNKVLSYLVNMFRLPLFNFFYVTTGLKYHKIHDLKKILKKLDIRIIDEKRFLFQYCSVLIGKV
jgi:ubiquinone/menaquinone biosynthesis C-methylase UbiE